MVTVTSITGRQRKPRFVYNTGADMVGALSAIDQHAPITVHADGSHTIVVGNITYTAKEN